MNTKKARAKGKGSLYVQKGIYIAKVIHGGKTFTKSTGCKSRREAERFLEDFAAQFRLGDEAETQKRIAARLEGVEAEMLRLRDEAPAMPLAGAWEAFAADLRRSRCSTATMERYGQRLAVFVRWMGKRFPDKVEVRAVDAVTADEFMRALLAGTARDGGAACSPKTYNDYRAILCQIWDAIGTAARAAGNPWKGIARMTVDRDEGRRRELTVEEMARVVGSIGGEMRTLFAIGIYTGLRLGDAVSLTWEEVDVAHGFISVVPHKTARHGTHTRIAIAPVLANVLAETPHSKRRGYVLPELHGEYERRSGTYLSRRIQRIFRAAGIETTAEREDGRGRGKTEIGFHSLRHTFVSLCANAGVPLAVVQSIVGHTNAAMTSHYFHVADNALRDAVAALPSIGDATADVSAVHALGNHGGTSALDEFAVIIGRMGAAELAEAERMIQERKGRA